MPGPTVAEFPPGESGLPSVSYLKAHFIQVLPKGNLIERQRRMVFADNFLGITPGEGFLYLRLVISCIGLDKCLKLRGLTILAFNNIVVVRMGCLYGRVMHGDGYRLNGEKTSISFSDQCEAAVIFARTGKVEDGARGPPHWAERHVGSGPAVAVDHQRRISTAKQKVEVLYRRERPVLAVDAELPAVQGFVNRDQVRRIGHVGECRLPDRNPLVRYDSPAPRGQRGDAREQNERRGNRGPHAGAGKVSPKRRTLPAFFHVAKLASFHSQPQARSRRSDSPGAQLPDLFKHRIAIRAYFGDRRRNPQNSAVLFRGFVACPRNYHPYLRQSFLHS